MLASDKTALILLNHQVQSWYGKCVMRNNGVGKSRDLGWSPLLAKGVKGKKAV